MLGLFTFIIKPCKHVPLMFGFVVGFVVVVVVFLLGGLRPVLGFSIHLGTSPLPVKGYKFGPALGTHGHRAVRVL